MNSSRFMQVFQKHLLVGSPKREEILAELKAHLQESGEIPGSLGQPQVLAHEYNRAHIGFLSEPIKVYLVPLLISTLLFSTRLALVSAEGQNVIMRTNYEGWLVFFEIALIVAAAIWIGSVLPRFQQSKMISWRLAFATLIAFQLFHVVQLVADQSIFYGLAQPGYFRLERVLGTGIEIVFFPSWSWGSRSQARS